MAARPAQMRRSAPPPPAPPPRNEKTIYPSLSLCCFLAYITINARPVSVCRGGGSGRGRRRRRAGAQAAGGAGPARPRRRSAPPRHWRRRSRAISSVRTTLTLSSGRAAANRGVGGRGQHDASCSPRGQRDCLLRLLLLPLRRLLPTSPRRRRRRRRWVLRRLLLLPPPPPLVPPLPLHQLHPGNSAAAAFGNPRQFPPRPSSPTLARAGTPPSANLGSSRPSSSSAAWFASSRPVRFFRSPLPVRTRPFGRRRSGLGVVGLGEPPEAGPGGPGARGAGSVYGRRPVGRARSHRGLNKGGCAAARAPGGAGGGGRAKERAGRRPRLRPRPCPCWLRPGSPWLGGGRTVVGPGARSVRGGASSREALS